VTNGIKIVFDTCAVIKILKGEYELSFLGIEIENALRFTSVITRMELFSKFGMRVEEEKVIRNFLSDVIVSPLDEIVEQKAVEIRRSNKIKLPDSIIAATSIVLDAFLLTDDEHLLNLSWTGFRAKHIFESQSE